MLKMSDTGDRACTFLTDAGGAIYPDRPYSCRAYPLERAVSRAPRDGERMAYCGVARHAHCLGHAEPNTWNVSDWAADQALVDFEAYNDGWVDIDSLFRSNPWGAQGLQSPALSMAFMACYNMDKFRQFVFESSFLSRFTVPTARVDAIRATDEALMLFGFDWVRRMLRNEGPFAEASGSSGGSGMGPPAG
jgi:hypothetical protein